MMFVGGVILFVILRKDATTAATWLRAWILAKYCVPCCATAQCGGAKYGSDCVNEFHGSARVLILLGICLCARRTGWASLFL